MSNMTQEIVSTISDILSRDSPPPIKQKSVQNLASGNNKNIDLPLLVTYIGVIE